MEKYKEIGIVRLNDFLFLDDANLLVESFNTEKLDWKFAYCCDSDVDFYPIDSPEVKILRGEIEHNKFGYHYDLLFEDDVEEIKGFGEFLLTDGVKEKVYEYTGEYYTSVGELFCVRYLSGDYLGLHNDGKKGKIGFVYNLNPTWNFTWGGITYYFTCADDEINPWKDHDQLKLKTVTKPVFNSLLLFDVFRPNYHFVSNLSPNAPYPRISINGWLE